MIARLGLCRLARGNCCSRGFRRSLHFAVALGLALGLARISTAGDVQSPGLAKELHGMILVPEGCWTVGTDPAERAALAARFDCHPTWLGDDLPKHEARLAAFWIDRFPVTNAQYLAFVEATGHARPDWWRRWGGVFPAEYADHPVTGVSGVDAAAYARWAGKRLPTAEEWEAAMGERQASIFAWGDAWPGPVVLPALERIFWDLPATRPVGSGQCGRSALGVEDFAGQVLQWVADTRPHHGVRFQLMKGASWFHRDPVNFRTAAGWYAYEGWRSAFTGFRCALDGDKQPPAARRVVPKQATPATRALEQLRRAPAGGPVALAAAGSASRYVSFLLPFFGQESVGLSAPETIMWNGQSVLTWRKTPDLTWTARTPSRAAYVMRFDTLRVEAEFRASGYLAEQLFTAVNLASKPATFHTSSCFNLQGHPMFYDCEQLRTFALDSRGVFVPVRKLSRGGECVRWITGPRATELGQGMQWALLAVVSRGGRGVIATGRAEPGSDFSIATNTMFTCLHTDSSVTVPPAGRVTTRQVFWFLPGKLEDLAGRWRQDLGVAGR